MGAPDGAFEKLLGKLTTHQCAGAVGAIFFYFVSPVSFSGLFSRSNALKDKAH